jgi:hypothetical protein
MRTSQCSTPTRGGEDEGGAPAVAEAEGQPAELDGPQYDIDEYVFTPPEGAEVSEVGAARLEAFAEYAAANGIAPEQYSGLIGFYEKLVSKEQARLKETDKAAEAEAVAALKDTWGTGAYSENLAVARKALKDLPEPLRACRSSSSSSTTLAALTTRPI